MCLHYASNYSTVKGYRMAFKNLKNIQFIFYTFLFLGFTLLLNACNSDKEPEVKAAVVRPVKTIIAKPSNGSIKKTYPAVVLATQQVDLSFRVSGKLQELPIRNGLKVKQGDVIAKLDERDFKTRISQLQSQISQANAQLTALKAGARSEDIAALNSAVQAAKAQLNQAQTQFNRTQALVKKQVIARQELDRDRSALTVAQANLNAKQQELLKGKAGGRKEDVSAQQAAIQGLRTQLKSLQDALEDATLRAPFDGMITSRKVDNFNNIQANAPIATIQRESSGVDLVFSIPAPDVVLLAPLRDKLKVVAVLDSFPGQVFAAERREFSREADATTQTYEGKVSIQAPEDVPILQGMTGNLIITANIDNTEDNNKYSLPLSAIASNPSGKPFVWVVNGANKVAKRDVTIGEASGANVAVSTGIKEGDVIVTAGISSLQDDMQVKPITAVGE